MITDRIREKRKLIWILLGLTVAFIWGNSLMPASVSSAISDFVSELLSRLFGELEDEAGHGFVRKLAHGLEFAVLGVEFFLLRCIYGWSFSTPVVSGLCISLMDETIQLFVPGRNGAIRDVWIDMGGFLFGLLAVILLSKLVERKRK